MKFGGVEMPVVQGHDRNGLDILCENFRVEGVLPDGRVFEIWVVEGFIFDGASIPRAFWRVCGHPKEVPRIAAALVHDWLYRAHVCSREVADRIYRAICIRMGLNGFCVGVEYYALRWFGGFAWRSHKESDWISARSQGALVLEGEEMKGE